ncbi:hypothetical protein KFL_005680040 [Klebsormidium nitens]|uniref:F-box domain-containing protein n=1 Tax=Klebsormidium nitens TaxID=105231 RepID=A0A1Y1IML6_KLENI|nr:hypothetical protein KFL_005680040 [Klebsormidium nitens]|eukprot:GAQ89837.1 hypothetical protein KFL_005680040 [Klebsormidium nitens]
MFRMESTLVQLLHTHSSIDVKTLCSLACVSKGFKQAVDDSWDLAREAARRRAATQSRELPQRWGRKYAWDSDYDAQYDARGRLCLQFVFSGVWGGSESAAMRPDMARRDFLVEIMNLKPLQRYRIVRLIHYSFDVVAAGILKFGSPAAYLAALLEKLQKRINKANKKQVRMEAMEAMLRTTFNNGDRPDAASLARYASPARRALLLTLNANLGIVLPLLYHLASQHCGAAMAAQQAATAGAAPCRRGHRRPGRS